MKHRNAKSMKFVTLRMEVLWWLQDQVRAKDDTDIKEEFEKETTNKKGIVRAKICIKLSTVIMMGLTRIETE